jgi:hypothetical protein
MFRNILLSLYIVGAMATAAVATAADDNKEKASKTEQSRKFKVKYKQKTDVDFGDALVEGSAKNPFMSMIGDRDQDFNRGFVKIRYDWHDALIMSVSGLGQ